MSRLFSLMEQASTFTRSPLSIYTHSYGSCVDRCNVAFTSCSTNIIYHLLVIWDFQCCDSWWRSVLFSHLTGLIADLLQIMEFFLFRVSTQALIPLDKMNNVVEEIDDVALRSNLGQNGHTEILVELKKPLKKKDQLKLDKEIVLKLQAEIDEEERIPRAKEEKIDEANIAWDDIQAKVDAYYQLAERLQAEEPDQFTIKEKATLFKELLEQRRKHFAAKRAEEKRNKPPTKTRQKKIMIT
ncbi:hypothetical protein Tco_0684574 [Tanacetum coccineum]